MKSLLLLFFLCSLGLAEEKADKPTAEESTPSEAIANLTDPKKLATLKGERASNPYKKKYYEDLKKGDWVKISLNFEWAKRQYRNWPLGGTVEATKNLRPKAVDIMTVWGCVNNKTKDYLTVQTYYILRRKQEFGKFSNTPGPNGIEKQVLKNTQIKPPEIQSISLWNENEDPELPPAGRK